LRFQFDTSRLIANEDHAGVEMPVRYRHRETSVPLETTIANFWTFEDGWPTKRTEYHDIERIQAFSKHHRDLSWCVNARPLGATHRSRSAVRSDRANARIANRRAVFPSRLSFSQVGSLSRREARPSSGFFTAPAGGLCPVLKWLAH